MEQYIERPFLQRSAIPWTEQTTIVFIVLTKAVTKPLKCLVAGTYFTRNVTSTGSQIIITADIVDNESAHSSP